MGSPIHWQDPAGKLARIIIEYSTAIKPGEHVLVSGEMIAEPFLRALYTGILDAGAHPHMDIKLNEQERLFHAHASEAHLDHITPLRRANAELADVWIIVWAEANTRELATVDPTRIARHRRAARPLREIMDRREAEGRFRWCGVGWPTPGMAQDAGMPTLDYEDFVFRACLLDRPDPIAAWREQSDAQQKIVDRLQGVRELHVTAPDTDLRVSVEGRRWVNCDGRANFPDGEVFTSPLEESANGHIHFPGPAVYHGNEAEGIRLAFRDGVIVDASAKRNEAFLISMLDMDEGARRMGEISVATNKGIDRFTRNILFDEKIGGTMHIAVGASYPECGGLNKSGLHWDLIKDMKTGGSWTADGVVVYKDGVWVG